MKNLREKILQQRQQLSLEEVQQKSLQIHQQLLSFPPFQSSPEILFYYPFRQEVDLLLTLNHALKSQKKVLLPRIQPQKTLSIHHITNITHDLKENSLGIKEPAAHCPSFPSEKIKLILIPGVAFDLSGHRLGYGSGYYDRFLPSHPALKVGIAYEFQILPNIIPQDHDIAMDYVITEKRVIVCKS